MSSYGYTHAIDRTLREHRQQNDPNVARERGRLAVEVMTDYRDQAERDGKPLRVEAFDAYIERAKEEAE